MFDSKLPLHTLRPRAWYEKLKSVVATCALCLFTLHPVWADDTEIFFNYQTENFRPNLLFIIDISESMGYYDCESGTVSKWSKCSNDSSISGNTSRLQRLITALDTVLDSTVNVNIGMTRFGTGQTGVNYPIRYIDEQICVDGSCKDVRTEIKEELSKLRVRGGTPTVKALIEAHNYFAGEPMLSGKVYWTSHPDSYEGGQRVVCADDSTEYRCGGVGEYVAGSPTYISPITHECQQNHVILVTDGEPSPDWRSANLAADISGSANCKSVVSGGLCGEELAAYMNNFDAAPNIPGTQEITTHSIGFNFSLPWLGDLATAGGGGSYTTSSSNELVDAVSNIVSSALEAGQTFVAPTATIDQFTRLSHREEVYLALFNSQASSSWAGNLKKYKFNGADPTLKDQNGNVAVDPATGEFLPDSQSFWSSVVDGGDVVQGGAASKLDIDTRKMYSYLETGNKDLTAVANRMTGSNVTAALIGASDDTERDILLSWLTGIDIRDEDGDGAVNDGRQHIGDPLHSSPVVVSYGVEDGETLDNDNLNSLVFFGTNEGFLHAIDTNDGTEEYAFMPKELMKNVPQLFQNSSTFKLQPAGATQSTVGFNGVASRAIDGNTSGTYGENSVTHTQMQAQPWWEADLGGLAAIADIEIWNRTDGCCTNRLSDFHVLVSETPFTSNDLSTNLNRSDVRSYFHAGALDSTSLSVPMGISGRYIRIQLEGSNFLSLAEVEISGTPIGDVRLASTRPYGLDGDITLRTIDTNNNGLIESDDGDKAFLYVGMRRGGRNYYALDVSDKDEPKFLWSIKGGTGDFADLGQSWSKPTQAKIKIGSVTKDVLIFGGGYDLSQDRKRQRSPDSMGRAIYIVDADTGALVWSGGNPAAQPAGSNKHYAFNDMTYSIPADLSIVPNSNTGLLSQFYVGDMGGRLWRFDVNNGSEIAELVDGGIIADFGQDDSVAGARRFFGSPDLSLSKVDGELTINIGIGSGYRAHPLDKNIEDKFFLLQYPYHGYAENNYGVLTGGSYLPATLDDLYDTTSNIIAEGFESEITQAEADLAEAHGWFITMEGAGEKILDRSSTFDGVVRFVSYVPPAPTGPCEPDIGDSYFYSVNLLNGTPFEEEGEDDTDSHKKENRKKLSPTRGIAPPVSTIFVDTGNTVVPTHVSGVNKIHESNDKDLLRRWFWAENPE